MGDRETYLGCSVAKCYLFTGLTWKDDTVKAKGAIHINSAIFFPDTHFKTSTPND